MNKCKRKKQIYNQEVLTALSKKYGLTKYYIRQTLGGKRNSLISDQLKKEYKKMVLGIENLINKNQQL